MTTQVNISGLRPFETDDDWRSVVSEIIGLGKNPVVTTITRASGLIERSISTNLITNDGRDFIAAQIGGSASATAVAKWMGLSSDSGAPAAGDTALASEISTNGLSRVAATYAHTGGTNTFTQTGEWTATGTQNNIQKMGLFTASSSGTLVFETALATAKSVTENDTLTVVWTGTIGS